MRQVQLRTETGELPPFDFLADEGLQVRPNTISMGMEEGRDGKVVLPLAKVGSEEQYLLSDQALHAYRRLIGLYRADPLRTETPWFYLNVETEAPKRFYVKAMQVVYPNSREGSPLLRSGMANVEVELTIHYAGENESATSISVGTMSAKGSKATLASGYGSILNRIKKCTIVSAGDSEFENLASWKFWLGIRPEYLGFANFAPEWDLPYNGSGTETTDASAIGGKYLLFNLAASPSYALRTYSYLTDITAYGRQWTGSYRLLLRQRLSAANMAVSIQARYGYKNGNINIPGPLTSLSSGASGGTNWNLVDLGQVTIAPGDFRGMVSANPQTPPDLDTAVGRFKVEIWAELTSGSGNLHLDALYLVPDTNMIVVEGAQLKGGEGALVINTFEDDTIACISNFPSDPYALGEVWVDTSIDREPKAWGLPPEGGMLVFIGQSTQAGGTAYHNDSSNITQNHTLTLDVIERWLSYSGA